MKTEIHLIDRDNHTYVSKDDLLRRLDQIVGFNVMCYNSSVKYRLDLENKPIFSGQRLVIDDQPRTKKEFFQHW